MSSLSIRSMNWTVGLREIDADMETPRARARRISLELKHLLSDDDWNAWLEAAPDDNAAYAAAAEAKLAEVRARTNY